MSGRSLSLLKKLTEQGPGRAILSEIADAAAGMLGCERIFVFQMRVGGGFRSVVARTHDQEDISQPNERMSHHAIRRMVASDRTVFVRDARQDRRYRTEEVRHNKLMATSILVVPLRWCGEVRGGLYADHRFEELPPPPENEEIESLVVLAELALELGALTRKTREPGAAEKPSVTKPAVTSTGRAAPRAPSSEQQLLSWDGVEPEPFCGFQSANPDLRDIFDQARNLSRSNITILIQGETGTGKGLLARAVHDTSSRRANAFVPLHCGAVPQHLIESELLGHVKGAFTGAGDDHEGIFVDADGGTLFLDEVADMNVEMQMKLLRVLEDGLVRPVGAKSPRQVDVRLISSTSRDLDLLVRQGKFRGDLYYRLKGVVFEIPPLSYRPEDVLGLAEHFLAHFSRKEGREPPSLSVSARHKLLRYPWPGNVRELQNEMRRLVALSRDPVRSDHLSISLRRRGSSTREVGSPARRRGPSLAETVEAGEREAVAKALLASRWNKSQAALELGITRKALYRRMAKYGIKEEKK